jgi:hypothetical protein
MITGFVKGQVENAAFAKEKREIEFHARDFHWRAEICRGNLFDNGNRRLK